jgi:catechol 2,3-dioxygenase-like lactoylglutathione lyase family enzyme
LNDIRANFCAGAAMLDHVTIGTSNLNRATEFYDRALKPLGIERLFADGETAWGYGTGNKAFFWIGARDDAITGDHVAFAAPDRATIDAFHAAALAAGGRDNGAPGLRPHYHPRYYGAFVLDPDGHNIEAVCHYSPDAEAADAG